MRKVKGRCLCGQIRLELELEREGFDACHCQMCRRWGGGPALTLDGSADIKIEGAIHITVFESSAWAERGFCKNCGSHIFYRLKKTGFRNFAVGLFDRVDDLEFKIQLFIDKKPANYSFANQTEVLTEAEVLANYLPEAP